MKFLVIIAFVIMIFSQAGCYYDKPVVTQSVCDTSIVTYSGVINPIFISNCAGCHSGNNASNGVIMDTYAGAKAQITAGKLLGVIKQLPGFDAMPKNGSKVNDCNIAKIQKWIAAGAPNN